MGRATASSRIEGNRMALQFEGPSTFDAWIEEIGRARRFVHFENYILRDDAVGRRFRDVLIERARAGVQVRVLYDWVGCWATPSRYWRPFQEAGVEVRAFNRPSVRDPFGVLQRDHRKLVAVDGTVSFLGGFCVGQEWAGTKHEAPWRDTGVEIRGPAAAAAARTFERIWAEMGGEVPPDARSDPAKVPAAGPSAAWLIEGLPWRSRVYRATQLMASVAESRLWITDPYFLAPRPVAEALMAAARDGVDVRVLVPGHNNWPLVSSLSRGGYRALLRAGVRIFEWEGPMIHAKTSVVDGRWSRIGSSNLNAASLLGNWELDIGVLDSDFAFQVQGLFIADLASAVEIVLPSRSVAPEAEVLPAAGAVPSSEGGKPGLGVAPLDPDGGVRERRRPRTHPRGQTLTLADVVRAGSALGDAIAGHRVVGREDRVVLATLAALLLVIATVAALLPRFVGWTLAVLFGWVGLVLAVRTAAQVWSAWRGDDVRGPGRHHPGFEGSFTPWSEEPSRGSHRESTRPPDDRAPGSAGEEEEEEDAPEFPGDEATEAVNEQTPGPRPSEPSAERAGDSTEELATDSSDERAQRTRPKQAPDSDEPAQGLRPEQAPDSTERAQQPGSKQTPGSAEGAQRTRPKQASDSSEEGV